MVNQIGNQIRCPNFRTLNHLKHLGPLQYGTSSLEVAPFFSAPNPGTLAGATCEVSASTEDKLPENPMDVVLNMSRPSAVPVGVGQNILMYCSFPINMKYRFHRELISFPASA